MFSMHAHEVTPQQEPRLHEIVDRLCLLANMAKPRVGVSEMDMPERLRDRTQPQPRRHLRDPRPHEPAERRGARGGAGPRAQPRGAPRRRGHDDRLGRGHAGRSGEPHGACSARCSAAAGAGAAAAEHRPARSWPPCSSRSSSTSIAFLLTMALSRYRELAADRSGAILIGKPSVLASALVHVTGDMGKIPRTDLRKAEGMNAFFFAPALAGRHRGDPLLDAPVAGEAPRPAEQARKGAQRLVGLRDTLFGRTKQVAPNLDNLFALPTAALTLQTELDLVTSGQAGLCFKAGSGETHDHDRRGHQRAARLRRDGRHSVSSRPTTLASSGSSSTTPTSRALVTRDPRGQHLDGRARTRTAAVVRGVRLRAQDPAGRGLGASGLPVEAGHLLPLRPDRARTSATTNSSFGCARSSARTCRSRRTSRAGWRCGTCRSPRGSPR